MSAVEFRSGATFSCGGVTGRWLAPAVLQLSFTGAIDAAAMRQVNLRVRQLVAERTVEFVLLDGRSLERFIGDVRGEVRELMLTLRDRGVRAILGVLPAPVVKVALTTVALACGMALSDYPSMEHALRALNFRRAELVERAARPSR